VTDTVLARPSRLVALVPGDVVSCVSGDTMCYGTVIFVTKPDPLGDVLRKGVSYASVLWWQTGEITKLPVMIRPEMLGWKWYDRSPPVQQT